MENSSLPDSPGGKSENSSIVPAPKVMAMHPKLVDALGETVAEARARKLIVGVHSGLRTAEQQDKLYALGRTVKNPDGAGPAKPLGNIVTNGQAWSSWHNLGLAADLVFKNEKGQFYWPSTTDERWQQLGAIGEIFGLEWGGRWKFLDLPHFQMRPPNMGVKEARDIVFKQGIDTLWGMVV